MKPHNVVPIFGYMGKAAHAEELVSNKTNSKEQQLSLPFFAPHTLIMLMASEFKSADGFMHFATSSMAHLILDMRIAPRLDFIGVNRAHSFNILKSLNIEYRDMLGRSGVKSYEEFASKTTHLRSSFAEVLEPIQVTPSPVLVFFDNALFMSLCRRSLSELYEVVVVNVEDINANILEEQLRM